MAEWTEAKRRERQALDARHLATLGRVLASMSRLPVGVASEELRRMLLHEEHAGMRIGFIVGAVVTAACILAVGWLLG